jgi:YD repeat-containing protein
MTAGDRLRVRFHGGGQEDLMTGVRDGLIGMSPTSPDWPDWSTRFTHRVEYRPSSDPEVYARGYVTSETPPPCSYPTACGLPKGVLAFRAQSYNGEGNPPASVKYSYHDSRFDRHGLGWLGFGQVVEEDERSGAVMVRTYDQTRDPTTRMYPFLGSLVSAWSYVQSVQGGPYLVEQATFVNALKELGAWMQGKSFLPYLQQHSIKYYEIASPEPGPGDLPLQTRDLSVVIDRFGNPTLLEIKAGDGSSTRVELNYKTNTSQWILGQPWWLNVMNTTAGGESARRSVNYAHYNDGFLVKSQRFVHQDSAQRLTLEYAWDKYGNVTTETAISETGERRSTQVAYDTEGLFPTTVLNAAGHQVRLAYNVRFGGLAVYESPNLAKHQWAFDGLGRLAKHVLPTSAEVRHRYGSEPDGAISFPWQSQEVAGVILERTVFDSAGRPTRRETPGLHGSTNAERLVYHQNGQLGLRTVPYDVGNGPTTTGTRYEYDLAGRLTEIGLPDQNRWFYVYDGNTRRTYYNNKISGLRQSVATDDLGDIIEVRDAAGNPTTYRYGPFGHLAFIDGPGGPVLSRSVDAYGFTRSLKDANAGSQEYQYNSFGELWKVIDATGAVWEMAVGVKVVVA